MIWWKGTETMDNDTLDMAMLIVNRKEKATRAMFSFLPSSESSITRAPSNVKQPREVAEAWTAVKSHGSLTYVLLDIVTHLWVEVAYLSQQGFVG